MKMVWAAVVLSAAITGQAQPDPAAECHARLASDPQFKAIKDHLSLTTSEKTTAEMLADKSFPSEAQQRAIAVWITDHNECERRGEVYRNEAYPQGVAALVHEAEEKMIWHAMDLFQSRISFGEFNRLRLALAKETQKRVAAIIGNSKSQ